MHVDQSEGSSTSVIEYSKLAEIVGIKREEIEEWIIDAIVNNIIDARLDQENECIIFNSFAKRNMNDMSEWKNLKQKIKDTQTKFDKVLKLIRPK